MCDDLDLDVTDYISPSSEEERISMPSLPSLEKSDSVLLGVPKVPPPAASWAPWVITGLVLMGLNSYLPQLSPVSSLWSPLRAAIPVLHWVAPWWFVSPGQEPNLVSLAPLSHKNWYQGEHHKLCHRDQHDLYNANLTNWCFPQSLGKEIKV
ncbi:hypothetical protein DSO57_1034830 [Entomophthora muscae]|uniref:Uncharacterized protein n=1 Tax=Entomophthora muscae TaxID=34485 RepID=A0ACC2REL0_9FUNG|nr:hypothetical protein DSO57_1034830 [Entomophthora muscae]